ncbi:hypothetical protein OIU76_007416 [Salix suchowensis]|nr:hypothetical protein OIU76_007416 [Salix suchowensis]
MIGLKSHSDRSVVSWPEPDMQYERTQLSISTPMAPADFMPSTSSPNNEKTTLPPLRLSGEFDPIQMGLGVGVGSIANEPNQRQANWIPISWETSMGGPLGEVLHTTNNNATAECKNASSLNLMTERWDNSPWAGSSPTGAYKSLPFLLFQIAVLEAAQEQRTRSMKLAISAMAFDLLSLSVLTLSDLPIKKSSADARL